ncbi:DNA mismatch repair ATPase msh1 [Nowakowskiella sp. JEL0407]|nr:DNA mismatch repair ATPase msh1 [Nowakowskiella sp. JEL0407]
MNKSQIDSLFNFDDAFTFPQSSSAPLQSNSNLSTMSPEIPDQQPTPHTTELLREIQELQSQYPDHVLLVQVGSFYELYDTPELPKLAELLSLRVAPRKLKHSNYNVSGFPCAQLKRYVDILTNNGYTVAVADQVGIDENARTKRLKRSVVRVISAGTDIDFEDFAGNRFLLSISLPDGDVEIDDENSRNGFKTGLSWVDISTGELKTTTTDLKGLQASVARIQPVEVILDEKYRDTEIVNFISDILNETALLTFKPSQLFEKSRSKHLVAKYLYNNSPLESLENSGMLESVQIPSLGALTSYIVESFPTIEPYFSAPIQFNQKNTLRMDLSTLSALSLNSTTGSGSLFYHLNKTKTKMGHRLLALRLASPSTNISEINYRLNLVEHLRNNHIFAETIQSHLTQIGDIERLIQKLNLGQGGPYEFIRLLESIDAIISLKQYLITHSRDAHTNSINELNTLTSQISDLSHLTKFKSLFPSNAREHKVISLGLIKNGYNSKLDALRNKHSRVSEGVNKLQRVIEHDYSNCGIQTPVEITLGWDNRDGPYVEALIAKGDLPLFKELVSKQIGVRLLGRQRSERKFRMIRDVATINILQWKDWTLLKKSLIEYEDELLKQERAIFRDACAELRSSTGAIINISRAIAELDVAVALGIVARHQCFIKPEVVEEPIIEVIDGRHPVVEQLQMLHRGQQFTANDIFLGNEELVWVLTGPNMGGKSTFLRQTAIICVLAQIGSFVPAHSAKVGIVDQLFSRIGAGDDLTSHRSTFMIEMKETAYILNNATERSLVIMDEIGRGTATADGISIAYAVLKYLLSEIKCRTLFATHYHEIAKYLGHNDADRLLGDEDLQRIGFYHSSMEVFEDSTFGYNYKLERGVVSSSHGIAVAKNAGIPEPVINIAEQFYNRTLQHKY